MKLGDKVQYKDVDMIVRDIDGNEIRVSPTWSVVGEWVNKDEVELIEDKAKQEEKVNHPKHYNTGKYEAIDIIEGMDWGKGFNCGNALKYILRHEHKGKDIEDLEKAIWYLKREVERIKEE